MQIFKVIPFKKVQNNTWQLKIQLLFKRHFVAS